MSNTSDSHKSVNNTGLSPSGYKLVKSLMNRDPNEAELTIISNLLYEEPALIHSRNKLVNLIDYRKPVLKGIKDNYSGAVELSGKYACIINIISGDEYKELEEPGVSTMARAIRDIVAVGGRPVAHVFSVKYRPSNLNDILNNMLEYSCNTCIPVIKGNICYKKELDQNPVLNIITLGIINRERLLATKKTVEGQPVYIIGFAGSNKKCGFNLWSAIKDKYPDSSKMPEVLNHIREKLFIEGVLELFDNNIIAAASVVGQTGVIGAAANLVSENNKGMKLNIDKLFDDSTKGNYYKMLCEYLPGSILVIINKNKKEVAENILNKWLTDYCIIGEIIKQNNINCFKNNKSGANIPLKLLLKKQFAAREEKKEPQERDFNIVSISTEDISEPENYKEIALEILKQPEVFGKAIVYKHPGLLTGTVNMNISFPSDSGIIRFNLLNKSLSASINRNSKYLLTDIKTGTIIIIAKAIRDIVCSGSEPLAMSISLDIYKANNKYFKEQFELIYDGVEEAINQFNIALANFSLSLNSGKYKNNNGNTLAIVPTVCITGELKSNKNHTTSAFRDKGHMIYLIGRSGNDFGSSEYLKVIHGINQSPSPFIDINVESKLHNIVRGLIQNHLILSAHNISEGGLFFALLESAMAEKYGFDITSPAEVRLDSFLFSEAQSRIIVTVSPIRETEFIDFMIQQDFPFSALGHITKEELRIDDISYGSINEYIDLYNSLINSYPG
jgi:phosphoribosylformylglycinamidine (FGAM) synthase-like enzyme